MTELRYGQCARCGGSLTANHRCGPQPPMSAESRKALEQIVKDAMTTDKQAAMTTDALGPCPPPMGVYPQTYRQQLVTAAYADWQRRRAERAEELLRRAVAILDRTTCSYDSATHVKNDCAECSEYDDVSARVAAHFDSINSKGDDK